MKEKYADVIVDITHERLDRTFQYKVPPHLMKKVSPGTLVKVPFGNGSRLIEGYVIALEDTPGYDLKKMKAIADVPDMAISLETKLIALAAWIRETYGSTMIQALKTVLPVKVKHTARIEKTLQLALEKEEAKRFLAEAADKHRSAQARLLSCLLETPEISYDRGIRELKQTAAGLKSLQEKGVIRIIERRSLRGSFSTESLPSEGKIRLNSEQQSIYEGILLEWHRENPRPSYIYGITGSGKTMIYMELIRYMLEQGKQCIVLLPEIALTWQTVWRFYRQFGTKAAVFHSKMTPAEKADQMELVKSGQVQIMIGPRSALFTPFDNLGLIVVDEEHDQSYHSEKTPRYHARETSVKRGFIENAMVVFGSATPSVNAFERCRRGEYALFRLERRFREAKLPVVYPVDMREELRAGNRSIFSRRLQDKMAERLEGGEQIMLFLNRRGYAGFISCRACGHVIKCSHCDVSMTLHNNGMLVCHYCGFQRPVMEKCPECGSSCIGSFKAGTQQVEKTVRKLFPQAGILRMDADTTRKKSSYEDILSTFAAGGADILIGTQMIVKGHDFPNVTLVGVLAADISLYAGDYSASEKTYQLLVQAAGRAGRGEKAGEALIQTYHPEHYSIQAALAQDYDSFFEQEMEARSLMGYPPAGGLLAVHASCGVKEQLDQAMKYIGKYLIRVSKKPGTRLIGPAPETVAKIQDVYRQVIYVKDADSRELIRLRQSLERYIEMNKGFDPIFIQFDMNG